MDRLYVRLYRIFIPGRPMGEVFAPIDNFPMYMASNYGAIYSVAENKIKDTHLSSISKSGKYYVIVSAEDFTGKRCNLRVNRAVLMAFKPMDNYDGWEAHHIDENTMNNTLSNLEWKSHLDNCREHYVTTLEDGKTYIYTDEMVHNMCYYLSLSMPYEDIAKTLGIPYGDDIKSYLTALRGKKIRRDISDQYVFPNKMRNTAILSDEEIAHVCELMEYGFRNWEIVANMEDVWKDRCSKKSFTGLVEKIRSRKRFTRISDNFKF